MVSLVVELVASVVSLLVSVLPVSPFQQLAFGDAPPAALGWLNWLVPIGDMLTLLSAWAVALLLWRLVRKVVTIAKLGDVAK